MKAELVGFERSSYTDKKTSELKTGTRMYFIELRELSLGANHNYQGRRVFEEYTSRLDTTGLVVGQKYDLDYEKRSFNGQDSVYLTGISPLEVKR